jgi:hypothetical protein
VFFLTTSIKTPTFSIIRPRFLSAEIGEKIAAEFLFAFLARLNESIVLLNSSATVLGVREATISEMTATPVKQFWLTGDIEA